MAKYRKRPVVIEAVQYTHGMKSPPRGVCFCNDVPLGGHPHCHTLEGHHQVTPGDWIITGIKGEVYPCKPDIFAATYELVEE